MKKNTYTLLRIEHSMFLPAHLFLSNTALKSYIIKKYIPTFLVHIITRDIYINTGNICLFLVTYLTNNERTPAISEHDLTLT